MTEPCHVLPLPEQLALAFNARDLDAMTALLAPGATAQVLGSEFPVERGPAKIRATSLTYLLQEEQGRLHAEAVTSADVDHLLLRRGGGRGPLDCAIRVHSDAGQIQRLEHLVIWFRKADLTVLAARFDIPLA